MWINDDEPGIQADALEWLDKLAPPRRSAPGSRSQRQLSPRTPGTTGTIAVGEDNGDAHLKNLLVHHQVIVPVADGQARRRPLAGDTYTEFNRRRRKRLIIKV